jgi:hypothetical protein
MTIIARRRPSERCAWAGLDESTTVLGRSLDERRPIRERDVLTVDDDPVPPTGERTVRRIR